MKQKPPLEKNNDIEITIDALSSEGQGVGRYEGYAVFVPGALPGERIKAHVIKVTPGYGIAKLEGVLVPAEERVRPRCGAFAQCGGCTLQHLDYQAQLAAKRRQVYDALSRLGGIKEPNVLPVLGMDEPWKFRNKGAFPFGVANGRVEAGAFAARSHRLIPLHECPVQKDGVMNVVNAVRDWANTYGISAYDENTGRGTLRHVLARTAKDGDVMAVVVTGGRLPHKEELVALLKTRVPRLKSVVHNINSAATNVILGKKFTTVWGADKLIDNVAGFTVEVSAASFLQVNPVQTELLYRTAVEYAALTGEELTADIYCGIGTISMPLAKRAKRVVGIEAVPEAIADAKANAARNGIDNAEFLCGLAEEVLPKLAEDGLKPDVAVLDPPRKGAEERALAAVLKTAPRRIVYVSCNPATLARDVKYLCAGGYELVKAQPVDMFAHTPHVETVVLLSKKAQ